eukprot:COSAG01_NODE_29549_length_635_cov_0.639925_1_plen_35_part_10
MQQPHPRGSQTIWLSVKGGGVGQPRLATVVTKQLA